MAKLPTCPYCKKEVSKNQPAKKYQNKTYHTFCYQKFCEEKYRSAEAKNSSGSQQELYDYICKVFRVQQLTPYLASQLQKIFKENDFTYNGVLYTLKYWFEIKENLPQEKYGIGIVPMIYNEAKNFYIKKSILWEKNCAVSLNKEEKTVKVLCKNTTKKPKIDIESL